MERHQAWLKTGAAKVTADPPKPATITELVTNVTPLDRNNLARAAAKTAFNYLILRRPDVVGGPTFDAVREFILDGKGTWPVLLPLPLAGGEPPTPLNTAELLSV